MTVHELRNEKLLSYYSNNNNNHANKYNTTQEKQISNKNKYLIKFE